MGLSPLGSHPVSYKIVSGGMPSYPLWETLLWDNLLWGNLPWGKLCPSVLLFVVVLQGVRRSCWYGLDLY